jgi:hypothetical protein
MLATIFFEQKIHARVPNGICVKLFDIASNFNTISSTSAKKTEGYIGSVFVKNEAHKYVKASYDIQIEFIDVETILYIIQELDSSGKKLRPVAGIATRLHTFGQEKREIYNNAYVRFVFDTQIASNDKYYPRALGTLFYSPNGRQSISVRIAHKYIANDLDLTPTYN